MSSGLMGGGVGMGMEMDCDVGEDTEPGRAVNSSVGDGLGTEVAVGAG